MSLVVLVPGATGALRLALAFVDIPQILVYLVAVLLVAGRKREQRKAAMTAIVGTAMVAVAFQAWLAVSMGGLA